MTTTTTDCAPRGAPSAADKTKTNPAAALVETHGLDQATAEAEADRILAKATSPVRDPAAYVLAAYVPPKTASNGNGSATASPRRPGTRTCPVCRHPVAADGTCDCGPGGQTFTFRVLEPGR